MRVSVRGGGEQPAPCEPSSPDYFRTAVRLVPRATLLTVPTSLLTCRVCRIIVKPDRTPAAPQGDGARGTGVSSASWRGGRDGRSPAPRGVHRPGHRLAQ